MTLPPGHHMAAECAQAMDVLRNAASQNLTAALTRYALADINAVYTIARGSSDAAANILSYEFMRTLRRPVTSLPPSVFSLGRGVHIKNALGLVISQSGASEDLVRTTKGLRSQGAKVIAITNQAGSAVEATSDHTIPINAGPELAIPATKTVVGAIGAGVALLSALAPDYADKNANALSCAPPDHLDPARCSAVQAALQAARHVYVIGRDTGYGAAHEVALKLKECCAIHAEAYSSSEVLHGPLQLATKQLMVLILDTQSEHIQESLNQAEVRFRNAGCDVHRIRSHDATTFDLTPAMSAAILLSFIYPIILRTSVALGFDPDTPSTLSKVTQTT